MTTSAPKPVQAPTAKLQLSIHPTAIVADRANIGGNYPITIDARAIVHPFARLDSSAGPIEIGEAAVVWEKAMVGATPVPTPNAPAIATQNSEPKRTIIGAFASIHPHSTVYSGSTIGVHASVEVSAIVGARAILGTYAKLSPCTEIGAGVEVKPFTTVFLVGDRQMQRVNATMKEQGEVRELYEKGREKEITLLRRVVRGGGKWMS